MAGRGAQRLGRTGEDLAATHLAHLGYAILKRNVRVGHGEIDLLARHGDELVFVEVRLRRGGDAAAAASFDRRKQARLRAAALGYLVGQYGDDPPPWRVDLVTVDLDRAGRLLGIDVLPSALEDDA
ncbi:MAG: YraN family protein [Chloroflexi bacterium]|nr:YraN family protein [Chloroflexota bacterium]MBI4505189.1 YraN family protein [Chloroflexota bacterium]